MTDIVKMTIPKKSGQKRSGKLTKPLGLPISLQRASQNASKLLNSSLRPINSRAVKYAEKAKCPAATNETKTIAGKSFRVVKDSNVSALPTFQ